MLLWHYLWVIILIYETTLATRRSRPTLHLFEFQLFIFYSSYQPTQLFLVYVIILNYNMQRNIFS